MDGDDGDDCESCKLLISIELCIGVVSADAKNFTIIVPITLLKFHKNC